LALALLLPVELLTPEQTTDRMFLYVYLRSRDGRVCVTVIEAQGKNNICSPVASEIALEASFQACFASGEVCRSSPRKRLSSDQLIPCSLVHRRLQYGTIEYDK